MQAYRHTIAERERERGTCVRVCLCVCVSVCVCVNVLLRFETCTVYSAPAACQLMCLRLSMSECRTSKWYPAITPTLHCKIKDMLEVRSAIDRSSSFARSSPSSGSKTRSRPYSTCSRKFRALDQEGESSVSKKEVV